MAGEVIPILIRRAREDIVRHFSDGGATRADRALPFDPDALPGPARRLRRREFARMIGYGAVRETRPAHSYLDEERLGAYRASRRKRMMGLLGVAAAAVGAAVALG